jgi:hypothetical protein
MADLIVSIKYEDKAVSDRLSTLAKHCKDLGNKRLVVGTSVQYMAKHQLGLEGLPVRKFLGVSETDRAELIAIIDDSIASPPQTADTTLSQMGEFLLLSTDTRWEQEIDPEGKPWIKNTAYTIRMKKAQGRILKVLQATGVARASINYQIKS